MSDCYPDNPCTNYPDAWSDWCERCKAARPTVIVVTATGNAWHSDFVGVYHSLDSASADLDGVVWQKHNVPAGSQGCQEDYTYWTGTDPDLTFNTYAAHSEVVK